jgi:PAS domain S-box-containing protein/putative nucleotidyltransferase with HDIG domain
MIVEDEAIVALDIRNRLRFLGYDVAGVATTGEEAVRLASERSPDLILMDIMLDGELDGIDAAVRIREKMAVPVVFLTAYADEDTLSRAKVTEAFGYIIKPFEDRELHTTIEMALYKHKMETRLVENERFLATTLKSIGEAVVTTDAGGRVRFMNPVAEKMLGIPAREAVGRELGTIMHVVDEETGKTVIYPVGDLLREAAGHRAGSARRSEPRALVAAETGRSLRVPVDDSFAPIRDEKGRVLGSVLVLRDVTERRRSEVALEQSLRDLRRTLMETVNALAVTSEKRDPYTAGHQHRVSVLASEIALRMGFDEDVVECVRVSGVLHDLGKIYVPAEILAKPATLTEMEMGIMKTHPEVAYDILRSIPFPWPLAEIILQHHERYDGSGYPKGLSGETIRVESRILAVADVVEAMSSHRPYRAALGLEKALAEISQNAGIRYDPRVVDECRRIFAQGFDFESLDVESRSPLFKTA